jgi:SAM-dependent methyltransferase
MAKNRLHNSGIAQATCQNLPFASEKFDLLLDLSTIDHVPFSGVSEIFSEYYRVLKPKGLLAIAFWQSNFVTKYFYNIPSEQLMFDSKKVAAELKNNNFDIINSYDIGSLLTINESTIWLGPFLFWRMKAAFEDRLFNSVAKFEQYFKNILGGLHVFYARSDKSSEKI